MERGWIQIGIRISTHAKLVELKEKMGAKSIDEVIRKLLEFYEKGRSTCM